MLFKCDMYARFGVRKRVRMVDDMRQCVLAGGSTISSHTHRHTADGREKNVTLYYYHHYYCYCCYVDSDSDYFTNKCMVEELASRICFITVHDHFIYYAIMCVPLAKSFEVQARALYTSISTAPVDGSDRLIRSSIETWGNPFCHPHSPHTSMNYSVLLFCHVHFFFSTIYICVLCIQFFACS